MIGPGMLISDRYEIVDKVGSGGMADVYKAKDQRLNRYVAIKILKQEYSNDAKFVAKFRAEAQSVAGLSHPNIVNVYDVGEDDELYYIVMELVEGITLKKFIEKKGSLDVNEAIGIGIQIAQGMEAAHDNHIIHRDIKPQNIIISKEGKVKVTDFGIAKAATSNTITSNAMGSVHYISPEQARGGYSDEKSDIYSLGVTMYEMLSGGVPFEGDSTVTVALSHIQDDALPVDEVVGQVPHSLSKIVQKCMQKKPEMRYLTAASLISDLKRAVDEPDGDYVKLEPVMVDSSPTIKLSDDDLNTIKEVSRGVATTVGEPELEELPEDDDMIDPRLEKILKICSAVVAVILIVGVILIIGNFAGWWRFSGKDDPSSATSSPSVSADAEGKIPVPGLVGKSLEDAERLLEASGLHWQLKPVDSEAEPNQVTDQDPKEGELADKDSRVTIYYSQENDGVTIPDVVNKTEADARAEIERLGLSVGSTTESYSSSVEEGKVISTDPVVGSSVDKKTTVILVISKGPEGDYVTVPNIVGYSVTDALKMLSAEGLKGNTEDVSYVYSDKYKKDVVISQTVKNGKKVQRGTTVGYTVSLGPKDKATPIPKPTKEASYTYQASLTISDNPFEFETDDPATITLVLEQGGRSDIVWAGTLSYEDFPRVFPVEGWSDTTTGKVTLCKDGKEVLGPYVVAFKKVKS